MRTHFFHRLLPARDYQERPELDAVLAWWSKEARGVLALVGIGGAGKTAIVDQLLARLLSAASPNDLEYSQQQLFLPTGLFVYSFYNSSDPGLFFSSLITWLTRPRSTKRGYRVSYQDALPALQEAPPTLLVLDGLERVQDDGSDGRNFGSLTDDALRDFVQRVADGIIPNIKILTTTRFFLDDLEAAKSRFYKAIEIVSLPLAACVDLLQRRGVVGTKAECESIAEECGRHALTVDLAGGYLAHFFKGDARAPLRLASLDLQFSLPPHANSRNLRYDKEQSHRFAKLADRYREALSQSETVSLLLLEIICLYRSGIAFRDLLRLFSNLYLDRALGARATRKTRNISYESVANVSESDHRQKIKLLKDLHLISEEKAFLTAHPAVRDGFLRGLDQASIRKAHDLAARNDELLSDQPGLPRGTRSSRLTAIEEIIYHAVAAGRRRIAIGVYASRLGRYYVLGWRLAEYARGDRICRIFFGCYLPRDARVQNDIPSIEQARMFGDWAQFLLSLGQVERAQEAAEQCASLANSGLACTSHLVSAGGYLLAGDLMKVVQQCTALIDAVPTETRRYSENEHTSYCKRSYGLRGYAKFCMADLVGASIDFEKSLELQNELLQLSNQLSTTTHRVPVTARRSLFSLRGIFHSIVLLRQGCVDAAEQTNRDNEEACKEFEAREGSFFAHFRLVEAECHLARNNAEDAAKQVEVARGWATKHNVLEPLTWCYLLMSRIAALQAVQSHAAQRLKCIQRGRTEAESGLRIARSAGFSLYHVDLLNARGHLSLLEGDDESAEADLMTALFGQTSASDSNGQLYAATILTESSRPDDRGIFPAEGSGIPSLFAATNPRCGYAWGEAESRYLLAECILLRASRENAKKSDRISENQQSGPITLATTQARELFGNARTIWTRFNAQQQLQRIQHRLGLMENAAASSYSFRGFSMRKTIVELDLAGYSTVAREIEENLSAAVVMRLNDQIQEFVDTALSQVAASREDVVLATTGDGAILGFDRAVDAHNFALAVHSAAEEHNQSKTLSSARRYFRIGVATGDVHFATRNGNRSMSGVTIANAVRLEGAAKVGEIVVDATTYTELSTELQSNYGPEERVRGKREEVFLVRRCSVVDHAVQVSGQPSIAEVYDLFDRIHPKEQILRIMNLVEMPVEHRPSESLPIAQRWDQIVTWSIGRSDGLRRLRSVLQSLVRDVTLNPT